MRFTGSLTLTTGILFGLAGCATAAARMGPPRGCDSPDSGICALPLKVPRSGSPEPVTDDRALRGPGRVSYAGGGATSTGSGFFVDHGGVLLTNRHVVRGCATLRVRSDSGLSLGAHVLATDSLSDLALLRVDGPPARPAVFRAGPPPRPGDDVVAVGYPLSGLLADQVNVSTGTINALAGMYNDQRSLQMSAPVQPGSSGGPLFDASGNVVGVVVTKLNARVVAEAMGDIPQNVNFALKASVARRFLDANQINYEQAPSTTVRSNADVGDIGRRVAALVECWK